MSYLQYPIMGLINFELCFGRSAEEGAILE